jgi:hypothetical protein
MKADDGGLVRLTTVNDNIEASALKSLLQAHGILCIVQGEQHRSMLGTLGPYIQLHVLVPASELETARALLETEADEDWEQQDDEVAGQDEPYESWEIDRTRSRRKVKLIALFILFVFVGGPGLVVLLLQLLR